MDGRPVLVKKRCAVSKVAGFVWTQPESYHLETDYVDVVTTFRLKDLSNYGCDILLRLYTDDFYHLCCDNCVTAQGVSNMSLPRFLNGYDPDYESSLNSLISSVADSSPFSGQEDDDDDDDDDDGYNDDESDEIEHDGPHVNGAAAIEPSQELQSPEEQLHSLQSG